MQHECYCEDEAKILYLMYVKMNTLADADWVGKSVCCNDDEVRIVISGHTITISRLDGRIISKYSHPQYSIDVPH
jgi:hypothetical protein